MLESLINSPAAAQSQSTARQAAAIRSAANSESTYGKIFSCPRCDRGYKLKSSLRNHEKWECGKEPQFQCPYCAYRAKQKMHVARHIERMHTDKLGLRSEGGALDDSSPLSILKDDQCNALPDGIIKDDLEKVMDNPPSLLKSFEGQPQKG